MGKKNAHSFHVGYITRLFSIKLHISRHHIDKEFILQPQKLCLYQQQNLAAEIVPHLSFALRDLQLGKILLFFL